MMKALFIDPPYDRLQRSKVTPNYPLGLAYLASILKENGHEAIYVNLDWDPTLPSSNPFSRTGIIKRYHQYLHETSSVSKHVVWSNFETLLKELKPNLVGVTTSSLKIKSALKLLEIVKGIDSNIITVFGGHHSHIFAKEILEKTSDLDFIILGEGEQTLLELANHYEHGSEPKLDQIHGLVYRNRNGIHINIERKLIDDLDNLPFPSLAYYYVKKQLVTIPTVALMASRGCPFNCNYCATNNIWKRKVRRRSPRNVVSEIQRIVSEQKEIHFSFYDDCFTLDKKWLLEFCDILMKDKFRINWNCITSVSLVDEGIFKKIVQAGCVKVNIGVESGSERILKVANKKIELNVVRRIFKLSKKYRISTCAYVMIGFPSETEYDIRLTQDLIKEIQPNWVYCNVLIPLPGTRFFDQCVESGLVNSANAWCGDTIKSPIMNFTNTLSDEKFFELVDETFEICYKVNSNLKNLIKRAPVRQYLMSLPLLCSDIKRAAQYVVRKR